MAACHAPSGVKVADLGADLLPHLQRRPMRSLGDVSYGGGAARLACIIRRFSCDNLLRVWIRILSPCMISVTTSSR